MAEIKYDLMARKKLWFIISLLVIIPGIFSLAFQGLNLGIDFTGGAILHMKLDQATDTAEIRDVLADFDLGNSSIQAVDEHEFIVRTPVIHSDTMHQLSAAFAEKLGSFEMLRNELVGPVIGKELTLKALYALLIASVVMVMYITYRFELSFGIAAIVAITHDALVTLSIFSIFQIPVESFFVAAILTVIGYSINATIVIFDRIRENLQYKKGGSLHDLVNTSVWQTMARSINTALTIIFVLITMLIFGGETTKTFILAMLIGVISGAYSSIFIAGSVWLEIKAWEKRRKRMA